MTVVSPRGGDTKVPRALSQPVYLGVCFGSWSTRYPGLLGGVETHMQLAAGTVGSVVPT